MGTFKPLLLAFVSTLLPVSGFDIGPPSAILERLISENTKTTKTFTLAVGSAELITVNVEDFDLDQRGFSMTGKVQGTIRSDFILRGDATDIYGWVVLWDRNAAFEFTTGEGGSVAAEPIPVEKIYPICNLPDGPDDANVPAPAPLSKSSALAPDSASGLPVFIRPYPGTSINKLQSAPGAEKVIYVDITRIMNGETPKGWTREQMWAIWQGFTAGLSMYKVNITTDSNVYKAAGVRNSGKVVMYSETGRSFSPVNAFGTTRFATVYRKSTPQYNAGTLIHEVGHLLGLSHDGSPTAEYFPGFSAFQWCPVMGSHVSALSWTNTLWQWSKGQYLNANQKQDDLALINRHLPFQEDDITLAAPLQLQGTLIPAGLNWGQISAANDSDTFSFQLASGGGRVRLKIDRIEYARGSMLDVDATLRDATGKTVARNNKAGMRYAEFDLTLAAGRYSLTLKGGAEGTPSNGFSNYSSLGYYGITGEISGATVEIAAARNDDEAFMVKTVSAGSRLALRFPGGAKVADIGLHSVTGASVFSSATRVESIDLSGLRPGIYVLNVSVDGRNLTRRMAL